jgi:hypothetical protein
MVDSHLAGPRLRLPLSHVPKPEEFRIHNKVVLINLAVVFTCARACKFFLFFSFLDIHHILNHFVSTKFVDGDCVTDSL